VTSLSTLSQGSTWWVGGEEEKEYPKKTHGDAFVKASWCE